MANHIVTRQSVVAALNDPRPEFVEHYVARAILILFAQQTESERADNQTKTHNMRGFTGCDGRQGALTAKYYLKHRKLEPWMVDQWTRVSPRTGLPRLAKYWRQLDAAAQIKAAQKKQKNDQK